MVAVVRTAPIFTVPNVLCFTDGCFFWGGVIQVNDLFYCLTPDPQQLISLLQVPYCTHSGLCKPCSRALHHTQYRTQTPISHTGKKAVASSVMFMVMVPHTPRPNMHREMCPLFSITAPQRKHRPQIENAKCGGTWPRIQAYHKYGYQHHEVKRENLAFFIILTSQPLR